MRAGGLRVLSDLTAGTSSLNTSAVLEAVSSGRGFLPPRMTTVQRDAIVSPVEGLLIYNTVTDAINFYNGTQWLEVGIGDFWQIRDNLGSTFVRVAAGPTSPTSSIVGQIGSPVGYIPNQTVFSISTAQSYFGSLSAANGSNKNGVNIAINAGNSDLTTSSLSGGSLTISGGEGTTAGGDITISSGVGTNILSSGAISGSVELLTADGAGDATDTSGQLSLYTGSLVGSSGNVSIFSGTALVDAFSSSGSVSVFSGKSTGISGNVFVGGGNSSGNLGGSVSVSAGDSASGFNGGTVTVSGGDSPDQNGGNITLNPGASGSGTDGSVVIGLASSAPAQLRLLGSVGIGVNLVANAVTDDYTLTLPVVDGTNGYFLQFTTGGQLQWAAGGSSYTTTFVDGDLVAGVLTVTHSLNQRPVNVQIYTNTFALIIPDGVVLNSVNTAQVDLSSFTPLTGTWSVIVNP